MSFRKTKWGISTNVRLSIIASLTICFVLVLQYTALDSIPYAALIVANAPLMSIDGLAALLISRRYLSMPSVIESVALIGVAMLNDIALVSFNNELRDKGSSVSDAARNGAGLRLRPVIYDWTESCRVTTEEGVP